MSRTLTGATQIFGADLTANDASPKHVLGELGRTPNGNTYRYVAAGSSALTVGNLLQGPAEVANHTNLAPSNTSIGATSLTVTLGNTAATANQYAGGWAVIAVTPGIGYAYEIESHPAASGLATLTLTLKDSIRIALTNAASKVDLVANPYNGVIQSPTTATGTTAGVAVTALTAAYYGWIQTGGVANVLAQGNLTVGNLVVASNGTAGAVENAVNASTEAQAPVGIAVTSISSTESGAVKLLLD